MTKTLGKDRLRDSKYNPKSPLTRHPIHKKTQHIDEKKEKLDNDLGSSPSKLEKLYPEIPDDDHMDLDEKKHEIHKEEYKIHKNDKVNFWKQKLCNLFQYNVIYFWIFFGLTIIATYFMGFSGTGKPQTELSLKEKLNHIKDNFQHQNRVTFHILEKALEKVVNVTAPEPSAPAIFTVIVNKNAIYKSHEFSHNLADALAPESTVVINETKSCHSQPDEIKFKIDYEIQSVAEEKKLFVVIVDNLQNIPLESSMIFHSYCDHEAAPFKHAVFLFIVPLNDNVPKDSSCKNIDKIAFEQFKKIWNKASPDEIDSLITRITVNVINFR